MISSLEILGFLMIIDFPLHSLTLYNIQKTFIHWDKDMGDRVEIYEINSEKKFRKPGLLLKFVQKIFNKDTLEGIILRKWYTESNIY